MWPNPLWMISLYILAAVFNLSIGIMLGYFRFKGGSDNYTKSQLWALSLLALLFLMNFSIILRSIVFYIQEDMGVAWKGWWFQFLWSNFIVFTAAVLLAFGVVYPRPLMEWKRLRWLLIGIFGLGLVAVLLESYHQHENFFVIVDVDRIYFYYIFAIFIPVFFWLGEYSRQPSRESRMIYTILVWGFLFVYFTQYSNVLLNYSMVRSRMYFYYVVYIFILFLVLVRLAHALWRNRKRWSSPETLNLVLLGAALSIGLLTAFIGRNYYSSPMLQREYHVYFLFGFLTVHCGWMIIRPILFTYGLLRYRLLGSQVRPERALAIVVAVVSSTLAALILLNLLFPLVGVLAAAGSLVIGLLLIVPAWKVSERFVTKYLVKLEDVESMSMRRRRNIYLMGLQTAVFRGRIDDERDEEAIKNLKIELGITDREHELLLESISLNEIRRVPEKEVEEVYIIHKHGLLVSRYRSTGSRTEEEDDSDIFAGMFTALTEFVQETMRKGDEGARTTDTIDYGPATMTIERDHDIVMAALITGADDLELRQLMRDTLAEINEGWGEILTEDWDGDLDAVAGVEKVLREFVNRVKRRS